jgi:hypothetical protein
VTDRKREIGSNGAKFLTVFAIADSGAEHCIFPLSFAAALGLDQLKMPVQTTCGVGSYNVPTSPDHLEASDHDPSRKLRRPAPNGRLFEVQLQATLNIIPAYMSYMWYTAPS